jgi:hypothetical protein
MKLALTVITFFVSCKALASNQPDESLFTQLENDAAAYRMDPAMYEKFFDDMLSNMSSPEYLDALSTPAHLSKVQREKNSMRSHELIRATVKLAREQAADL